MSLFAKPRVPPGQTQTAKWPVLHYGSVPFVDRATWTLEVSGETDRPARWDWTAFAKLPRAKVACDIHCVTTWSRLDNTFEGVATKIIHDLAPPRAGARFVFLHAAGGWTTNLPLADFLRTECLFATHHDGKPLDAAHGGPVRVVVPHLYFWKSAKWVTGVEYLKEDKAGFWERNGYHMRGDPWSEERYS